MITIKCSTKIAEQLLVNELKHRRGVEIIESNDESSNIKEVTKEYIEKKYAGQPGIGNAMLSGQLVFTKGDGGIPLAATIRIGNKAYFFEVVGTFSGSILDFADACKKLIKK
jgi:hypothetical protein